MIKKQVNLNYLKLRGFKEINKVINFFDLSEDNKIKIVEPLTSEIITTRILNNNKYKYIKPSGKNGQFLNFNKAIEEANNKNFLILTEGEFDTITVFYLGYKNVISLGGVANINKLFYKNNLIAEVKAIEEANNKNFYICDLLDNDEAGEKATTELKEICKINNLKYINLKAILKMYNKKDIGEILEAEEIAENFIIEFLKNEIIKGKQKAETEEAEAQKTAIKKVVANSNLNQPAEATTEEEEETKEKALFNNNNKLLNSKKQAEILGDGIYNGITKNFNIKILQQFTTNDNRNIIKFLIQEADEETGQAKGEPIEAETTAENFTTVKDLQKFIKNIDLKFYIISNNIKFYNNFLINILHGAEKISEILQVGFVKENNKKYFYDGKNKINFLGIAEPTNKQATAETLKKINLCNLQELAEKYKNNLFLNDFKFFDMLETIKNNLLNFNNKKIVSGILATVGSCFLNHIYNDLNIKKQILFLCGEAGSGKSATVEKIMNNLLLTNNKIEDINTTKIYGLIKQLTTSNFSTIYLNEFKGGEGLAEKVEEIIKAIYDGTEYNRSKPTGETNFFKFINNFMLAGEEGETDKATSDRLLKIIFDKETSGNFKNNFYELAKDENQEKLKFLGYFLLIQAINTSNEEIKKIYTSEEIKKIIEITEIEDERQKQNLKTSLTSLIWIFEKIKIETAEKTELITALVSLFNLKQENRKKNKFANTLNILNTILNYEEVSGKISEFLRIADGYIYINTSGIFSILLSNRRYYNQGEIINDLNNFNENLKNTIAEYNQNKKTFSYCYRMGEKNKNKTCFKVNIFKFIEFCNKNLIEYDNIITEDEEKKAIKKQTEETQETKLFKFNGIAEDLKL